MTNGGHPSRRFVRSRLGSETRTRQDVSLTVVVPTYNEGATITDAVQHLLATGFPCPVEFIVVDDGSTDDTISRLNDVEDDRLRVVRHAVNKGKGAALQTGAAHAKHTHMVPFDADLEYAAEDLPLVVEPILAGHYDVVYGARLFGVNTVYQSYRYAVGNRAMTSFANVLFDSNVTDLHTCFKVVPTELFRALDFHEEGFGLDTELTAFLLRLGIRPYEVPISYQSRFHRHGKKISWKDGVHCLRILARVRVSRQIFRNDHARQLAADALGGRSVNALRSSETETSAGRESLRVS